MSDLTPDEVLRRAADVLAGILRPFVEETTAPSTGGWVAHYQNRDQLNGRRPTPYSMDDPRFLLQVLINDWRSFGTVVGPKHGGWAREIRDTLNVAAHDRLNIDNFSARRAIETMGLLTGALTPDAPERASFTEALRELAPQVESAADTDEVRDPFQLDDEDSEPGSAEVQITADAWSEVTDREDLGRGYRRTTISHDGLTVEVVFAQTYGFAAASQHLPPAVEVRILNDRSEERSIESIALELSGFSTDPCGVSIGPIAVPAAKKLDEVVARVLDRETLPAEVVLGRNEIGWAIEPTSFAELETAQPATFTATTSVSGRTTSASAPVWVLARDEWAAFPHPELLAAFVAPGHALVSRVISEAQLILKEATGDGTLRGYEDDASRVVQVGKAVFEAIGRLDVGLEEPRPSTHDSPGFRLQRPDELAGRGIGSTIDLSLLYASVLEAAELSPVLTVLGERALGGFLAENFRLSDLALTSPDLIKNVVRSGMLVPVNTAGVAVESSFESAQKDTERFWDRDIDEVDYVVDIAACRRRVQPLPSVRRDGEKLIIEVERPAPMPLPALASDGTSTTTAGSNAYPRRVERWRTALLDLSFRNPLLKLAARSGEELHIPEDALPRFEDILAGGETLTLVPGVDMDELVQGSDKIRTVDPDAVRRILEGERRVHVLKSEPALGRALDRLRRQAKVAIEETGNNALYVTIGALKWKDKSGKDALAPLFLLPVRLEGRSGRGFTVTREGDEVALPNFCLIEKLRRDYGIEIPALEDPPRDESGIDIPAVLQTVRRTMSLHGKDFTVESHVRLAILQFATLEMWRDVSDNWELLAQNPVVHHLIHSPTETFSDPVPAPPLSDLTEAEEHLPVPSDGSQLKAVRWAREGRTFVLEGPPGTGKSQTITNMVANALAHGQTVLFVAEKQAALDVVRGRLDKAGLGPLSLDLHGRDLTIRKVRDQLEKAWTYSAFTRDSRAYQAVRDDVRNGVRELTRYRDLLHAPGPADVSLWRAHSEVTATGAPGAGESFRVPLSVQRGEIGIKSVLEIAREVRSALQEVREPVAESPWSLAGPVTESAPLSVPDRHVAALAQSAERLSASARDLLRTCPTDRWAWLSDTIEQLHPDSVLVTERASVDGTTWAKELHSLATELDAYRTRHEDVLGIATPAAREADVSRLRLELNEAHTAGMLKRKRRVQIVTEQIQSLTVSGSLAPEHLHRFLNDLELMQTEGRRLASDLTEVLPGSAERSVDEGGNRLVEVAEELQAWQTLRASFTDKTALDTYVQAAVRGTAHARSDALAIRAFSDAWHALIEVLGCTPLSLGKWSRNRPEVDAIFDSLPEWVAECDRGRFGALDRLRRAQSELIRLRDLGFDELADKVQAGTIDADRLHEIARQRLAEAVREERLDATGLDSFSAKERNNRVAALRDASKKMRDESVTALPHIVRTERGVNPTLPTNDLAALRREFQRKSGGSIRELIHNHGDALLRLTPCLLMSPGSVARFIPADAVKFDLVIFDEASQIRVADSVGALGRARAAIIVGDSQQMPPTSVFAASIEIDDEEHVDDGAVVPVDQDSILKECVDSNIESLALTWHYRSQHESLIAFSNRAYYHDGLSTFPTPPVTRPGRGLEFEFVGGHFDGGRKGTRTNPEEAAAIVRDIERRLAEDPEASIGVVTLNTQQRDLLLDQLERLGGRVRAAMNRAEDALFVKNLENVQGDERDIILFSLAFSPDPVTERLGLTFGPLTADGGERRLNVAITRARRQVKLFASFRPSDIDLSRTKSRGLRDLRKYLQFACGETELDNSLEHGHNADLHRQDIARALENKGLEVLEVLGHSDFKVDLAVRQPDSRGWVAVLLDGEEWARRTTASDRDLLPNSVLAGPMGWSRVERIWLPEWIQEPDQVASRILSTAAAATQDAVEDQKGSDYASAEPSHLDVDPAVAHDDEAHSESAPDAHPATVATPPHEAPVTYGVPPSPFVAALITGQREAAPEERAMSDGANRPDALTPQSPTPEATPAQPGIVLPAPTPAHPPTADPQTSPLPSRGRIFLEQFHSGDSDALVLDGALDRLDEQYVRSLVKSRIDEVVSREGPVESHRLAFLVGKSFGMSRMRTSRRDEVLNLVPSSQKRHDGSTMFIWPTYRDPKSYNLVRTDNAEHRKITEIPREEIANAVRHTLFTRPGIPQATLRHSVRELLGYRREGSQIRERIDEVIGALVNQGVVVETARGLYLSEESSP